MALRKGQKSKDEMAKDTPGYLPPGKRPKCHVCDRELLLNIYHPYHDQRFDHDTVERVDYGYQGNGIFCTAGCGYKFGLAVAKRVLHRKKDEQGSSGNPLVDNGTIPKPENM